MTIFMGTSFRAQPPCEWLPGHAPWMHTGWCTAVAWRPARRAACLHLPLEGAGLVLGFAGRSRVPCRPIELHPLGQLLLTAVFQDFSGFEIDLHGVAFPAREARLRGWSWGLKNKKPLLRFFLRAVCCSGAPAGAGQFSRASGPAAGGIKRYALRPLAAKRPVAAAFVFFFL